MSNKKPKYKVGDQVQLKSGGPSMTIKEAIYPRFDDEKEFTGEYRCQWFAGKKLDNGVFPEDSLQPYVTPQPNKEVKKK